MVIAQEGKTMRKNSGTAHKMGFFFISFPPPPPPLATRVPPHEKIRRFLPKICIGLYNDGEGISIE
jgi:hypothetical protein